MDEIESRIVDLRSNDEAVVRQAAQTLAASGDERAIPGLMTLFEETESYWVRNVVAGALADLDAYEALPLLVRMALKVPEDEAGSLVFAMQEFDCRPFIDSLAKLLCTEIYERRQLAFMIIEEMKGPVQRDGLAKARLILQACVEGNTSDDTRAYAQETIRILGRMSVE